jgi:hypothetical protein
MEMENISDGEFFCSESCKNLTRCHLIKISINPQCLLLNKTERLKRYQLKKSHGNIIKIVVKGLFAYWVLVETKS